MAFWSRIRQSKLRQFSYQFKAIPYASLINPTAAHSKACVSEIPHLIPHGRPTDFGGKVRFFAAPVQFQTNTKKVEQSMSGPRLNEKITAEFVRLVLDEEHFIVSRREALERARTLDLDLVEVEARADPPVCKIMDFHKEKYKKELREKEKLKIKSDKTLRADSKEVKFSPKTEAKDLKMKADMVKRFMEKGYRVKIDDVALIECEPTLGKGKEAFIIVRHVKFGPSKKGGAQKKGSEDASGVTSQVDNSTVPQRASSQSDISDPDTLHVTPTRARTTPLPLRESSYGTQNRHGNNEPRNPYSPTRGMDNRGAGMREPHTSYQRTGTPTDLPFSPTRGMDNRGPVMREPHTPYQRTGTPMPSFSPVGEPRQAQTNAPVFRNLNPPPNDIPKQEPSSPSAPCTPGLGFGIFSNPKGDAPARQGVSERIPSDSNSPGSRPDSSQRPGTSTSTDKVGQRGFGIFSRELK
ncbi:hypothetical protein D8674_026788 [Pyrus ussuriensis x Pyrus communis]|uniref:Translation initiation factor 3 N-terminal domain-containing protein n=1 Tax=Pyrus ussuriensis x Pyrus communis TaxID=2448454 RepID=A0A5N5IMK4_9ROSA|nr:hypothetical protein D8674_026788 [Pyrus ussuriensis x Pyrus communis]